MDPSSDRDRPSEVPYVPLREGPPETRGAVKADVAADGQAPCAVAQHEDSDRCGDDDEEEHLSEEDEDDLDDDDDHTGSDTDDEEEEDEDDQEKSNGSRFSDGLRRGVLHLCHTALLLLLILGAYFGRSTAHGLFAVLASALSLPMVMQRRDRPHHATGAPLSPSDAGSSGEGGSGRLHGPRRPPHCSDDSAEELSPMLSGELPRYPANDDAAHLIPKAEGVAQDERQINGSPTLHQASSFSHPQPRDAPPPRRGSGGSDNDDVFESIGRVMPMWLMTAAALFSSLTLLANFAIMMLRHFTGENDDAFFQFRFEDHKDALNAAALWDYESQVVHYYFSVCGNVVVCMLYVLIRIMLGPRCRPVTKSEVPSLPFSLGRSRRKRLVVALCAFIAAMARPSIGVGVPLLVLHAATALSFLLQRKLVAKWFLTWALVWAMFLVSLLAVLTELTWQNSAFGTWLQRDLPASVSRAPASPPAGQTHTGGVTDAGRHRSFPLVPSYLGIAHASWHLNQLTTFGVIAWDTAMDILHLVVLFYCSWVCGNILTRFAFLTFGDVVHLTTSRGGSGIEQATGQRMGVDADAAVHAHLLAQPVGESPEPRRGGHDPATQNDEDCHVEVPSASTFHEEHLPPSDEKASQGDDENERADDIDDEIDSGSHANDPDNDDDGDEKDQRTSLLIISKLINIVRWVIQVFPLILLPVMMVLVSFIRQLATAAPLTSVLCGFVLSRRAYVATLPLLYVMTVVPVLVAYSGVVLITSDEAGWTGASSFNLPTTEAPKHSNTLFAPATGVTFQARVSPSVNAAVNATSGVFDQQVKDVAETLLDIARVKTPQSVRELYLLIGSLMIITAAASMWILACVLWRNQPLNPSYVSFAEKEQQLNRALDHVGSKLEMIKAEFDLLKNQSTGIIGAAELPLAIRHVSGLMPSVQAAEQTWAFFTKSETVVDESGHIHVLNTQPPEPFAHQTAPEESGRTASGFFGSPWHSVPPMSSPMSPHESYASNSAAAVSSYPAPPPASSQFHSFAGGGAVPASTPAMAVGSFVSAASLAPTAVDPRPTDRGDDVASVHSAGSHDGRAMKTPLEKLDDQLRSFTESPKVRRRKQLLARLASSSALHGSFAGASVRQNGSPDPPTSFGPPSTATEHPTAESSIAVAPPVALERVQPTAVPDHHHHTINGSSAEYQPLVGDGCPHPPMAHHQGPTNAAPGADGEGVAAMNTERASVPAVHGLSLADYVVMHGTVSAHRMQDRNPVVIIASLVTQLVLQHTTPLALGAMFIVATNGQHLDVIKIIYLMFFVVFLCFPVLRQWKVLMGYTMITIVLLFAFGLVFNEGDNSGTSTPKEFFGVSTQTLGIATSPTLELWTNFVLLALSAAQQRLVSGRELTFREVLEHLQWTRLSTANGAVRAQARIALFITGCCFFLIGLVEPRSALVAGFMVIFALVFVGSVLLPSATTGLWVLSTLYSVVSLFAVAAFQVPVVQERALDWIGSLPDCRPPPLQPNTTTVANATFISTPFALHSQSMGQSGRHAFAQATPSPSTTTRRTVLEIYSPQAVQCASDLGLVVRKQTLEQIQLGQHSTTSQAGALPEQNETPGGTLSTSTFSRFSASFKSDTTMTWVLFPWCVACVSNMIQLSLRILKTTQDARSRKDQRGPSDTRGPAENGDVSPYDSDDDDSPTEETVLTAARNGHVALERATSINGELPSAKEGLTTPSGAAEFSYQQFDERQSTRQRLSVADARVNRNSGTTSHQSAVSTKEKWSNAVKRRRRHEEALAGIAVEDTEFAIESGSDDGSDADTGLVARDVAESVDPASITDATHQDKTGKPRGQTADLDRLKRLLRRYKDHEAVMAEQRAHASGPAASNAESSAGEAATTPFTVKESTTPMPIRYFVAMLNAVIYVLNFCFDILSRHSSKVVWVALFFAAIFVSSVLNVMYAFLFAVDLRGRALMLYALFHVAVAYAYPLFFIPAIPHFKGWEKYVGFGKTHVAESLVPPIVVFAAATLYVRAVNSRSVLARQRQSALDEQVPGGGEFVGVENLPVQTDGAASPRSRVVTHQPSLVSSDSLTIQREFSAIQIEDTACTTSVGAATSVGVVTQNGTADAVPGWSLAGADAAAAYAGEGEVKAEGQSAPTNALRGSVDGAETQEDPDGGRAAIEDESPRVTWSAAKALIAEAAGRVGRVLSRHLGRLYRWTKHHLFSALGFEVLLLLMLASVFVTCRRVTSVVFVITLAFVWVRGRQNILCDTAKSTFFSTCFTAGVFVVLLTVKLGAPPPELLDFGPLAEGECSGWWRYLGCGLPLVDCILLFATVCYQRAIHLAAPARRKKLQSRTVAGHHTMARFIAAHQAQVTGLMEMRRDDFEAVMPPIEGKDPLEHPRSIAQFAVAGFTLTFPPAVLAFVHGALSSSAVAIVQMLVGFYLFVNVDQLAWGGARSWRPVCLFVFGLMVFQLCVNLPPVLVWATQIQQATHTAATNGTATSEDLPSRAASLAASLGVVSWSMEPFWSNLLLVLFMWSVFLQHRLYNDFVFTWRLYEIFTAEKRSAERHTELIRHLRRRALEQTNAVRQKLKEMHDRVEELRVKYNLYGKERQAPAESPKTITATVAETQAAVESEHKGASAESETRLAVDKVGEGKRRRRTPRASPSLKPTDPPITDSAAVSRAESVDAGEDVIEDNNAEAKAKSKEAADDDAVSKLKTFIRDGASTLARAYIGFLLPKTYRGQPPDPSDSMPKQMFSVTVDFLARHTSDLCAVAFIINFVVSGTAADMVPSVAILTYAMLLLPWPPEVFWAGLRHYTVVCILSKSAVKVLVTHVELSEMWIRVLSFVLVDLSSYSSALRTFEQNQHTASTFEFSSFEAFSTSSSVLLAQSATRDIIFNFAAFATLLVHEHLCRRNGVYHIRKKKATKRTHSGNRRTHDSGSSRHLQVPDASGPRSRRGSRSSDEGTSSRRLSSAQEGGSVGLDSDVLWFQYEEDGSDAESCAGNSSASFLSREPSQAAFTPGVPARVKFGERPSAGRLRSRSGARVTSSERAPRGPQDDDEDDDSRPRRLTSAFNDVRARSVSNPWGEYHAPAALQAAMGQQKDSAKRDGRPAKLAKIRSERADSEFVEVEIRGTAAAIECPDDEVPAIVVDDAHDVDETSGAEPPRAVAASESPAAKEGVEPGDAATLRRRRSAPALTGKHATLPADDPGAARKALRRGPASPAPTSPTMASVRSRTVSALSMVASSISAVIPSSPSTRPTSPPAQGSARAQRGFSRGSVGSSVPRDSRTMTRLSLDHDRASSVGPHRSLTKFGSFRRQPDGSYRRDNSAAPSRDGRSRSQAPRGAARSVFFVDADDEDGGTTHGGRNGTIFDALLSSSVVSRIASVAKTVRTVTSSFAKDNKNLATKTLRNIDSVSGTGADLYAFYLSLDLVTVLFLVLFYFRLAGQANGNFIDSVQQDLLPGPLVMMLFAVVLLMVIERVVYVVRATRSKTALHVIHAVAAHAAFAWWKDWRLFSPDFLALHQASLSVTSSSQAEKGGGAEVTAASSRLDTWSLLLASLLIVVRLAHAYVSAAQIRLGFAILRRHDPFTTKVTIFHFVGNFISRAIPFLFEMRVVLDWMCVKTSLRLRAWVLIEDIHMTLYDRFVEIEHIDWTNPTRGVRYPLLVRAYQGIPAFAGVLLAVFFPLFYYSTFNPGLEPNSILSASLAVSLGPHSELFTARTLEGEEPFMFAEYLAKTRPGLAKFDLVGGDRTVELLPFSTCSAQVWAASPPTKARILQAVEDALELFRRQGAVDFTAGAPGADTAQDLTDRSRSEPESTAAAEHKRRVAAKKQRHLRKHQRVAAPIPETDDEMAVPQRSSAFSATAAPLEILSSLTLERAGASANAPLTIHQKTVYQAPLPAVKALYNIITGTRSRFPEADTSRVRLPGFVEVILFNRPANVVPFSALDAGAATLAGNRVDCELELVDSSFDPSPKPATATNAPKTSTASDSDSSGDSAASAPRSPARGAVLTWCLRCAPLFIGGNTPDGNTTEYPGMPCLDPARAAAWDRAHATPAPADGGSSGNGGQPNQQQRACPPNYEREAAPLTSTSPGQYSVVVSEAVPLQSGFLPNVGIIALYTTFILTLASVLRRAFSGLAHKVVLEQVAEPQPIAAMINYLYLARSCAGLERQLRSNDDTSTATQRNDGLILEEMLYLDLLDMLRDPSRVLEVTGRRVKDYNAEGKFVPSYEVNL